MAMPIGYLENMCHQNEVNGFKLNDNSTILLDSCVDLTKNYSRNAQKNPINFNFNKITDINDFKQKLKIHLDNVYSYIDILYQIKFFNEEFHKGCSIKNIANYLLEDNQSFLKYSQFLLDLIEAFILLCKYKAMNISKFTDLKIRNEYQNLSVNFRKYEEYFYTHIYQPSESYDEEFLDEMSNLLAR